MIVRREGLEELTFCGLSIFDYTSAAGLGTSVAVVGVPAGAVHPEAWSRRSDKYYLVLAGELEFSVEDQRFVLGTGDFCFVEQGKRFSYANRTPSPATLVLVHTPSFDRDAEILLTDSAV